jgi:hypothetical protein
MSRRRRSGQRQSLSSGSGNYHGSAWKQKQTSCSLPCPALYLMRICLSIRKIPIELSGVTQHDTASVRSKTGAVVGSRCRIGAAQSRTPASGRDVGAR